MLRIALMGGAVAFAVTEAIGLAAALFPAAWLGLFGQNPRMLAAGAANLRTVGPAYGFFGLGLALYFASQGGRRLFWPVAAGLLRLIVVVGLIRGAAAHPPRSTWRWPRRWRSMG